MRDCRVTERDICSNPTKHARRLSHIKERTDLAVLRLTGRTSQAKGPIRLLGNIRCMLTIDDEQQINVLSNSALYEALGYIQTIKRINFSKACVPASKVLPGGSTSDINLLYFLIQYILS